MMPNESDNTPWLRVRYLSVFAVLLLFVVGCQRHDHEAEELEAEAIALHDSLVVIESEVRDVLAEAAAAGDGPMVDSLNAIRADLETWSGYLVEPPGADDDHEHDHDHEPAVDLTPEQMLEVQQSLLDGIEALQMRLQQLNLDAPEGSQ